MATTKKLAKARARPSPRSVGASSAPAKKSGELSSGTDEVSAFITTLDAGWQGPFATLRERLMALPGVTEHIKWKAPSFCHRGDDRVTVRVPPKGGLQLILHRGVAVKDTRGFAFADPSGLAVWAAPDRGVVTFDSPEELSKQVGAVVALARAWMDATRDD